MLVAAIQLAIMLGATFSGLLLSRSSAAATVVGGTMLFVAESLIVGSGERLKPWKAAEACTAGQGESRCLKANF